MTVDSNLGIGLSDGSRSVRLMLINRPNFAVAATLLWSGADSRAIFAPSTLERTGLWTLDRPVQVEIHIAADHRVTILVDGVEVRGQGADPSKSLIGAARWSPVISTSSPSANPAMVQRLEFIGLPPTTP